MALGQVGSMAVALLGDIKDFENKMDTATGKVSAFDKSVAKMGAAVTRVAKMAALAAAAAVTAFAVSSVKSFVAFDTGMREVFTLMPELSSEAKEEMMADVMELAETIAVVPEEIIPALYQAISRGVPRENVFEFMEIAGKAAIGGVTTLEVAVTALTNVTNAYGSEVISVQEVADIMFTTVRKGATNFEELSERLFQAVPIAAAVGIEFSNIAAMAAQVTLSGVPMRVAMTQIRSLINEVAFEGKELNRVFQEASGMTFPEFIATGGDAADMVAILEGAANDAGISVAELTANLEAQQALLNLSGIKLDSLRLLMIEYANVTDAVDTAYEEMAAGIKYQLDRLAVWWKLLQLDIGKDLTENLKDLLGWLQDNREAIGDSVKAIFDGLISGMKWLSDNAGIVKAALITMAVGFTALLIAAHPAAAALTAIVSALAYFESTGGVAGAYDAVQNLAQAFRDLSLKEEGTVRATEAVTESLVRTLITAGGALQDFLDESGRDATEIGKIYQTIVGYQEQAIQDLEAGMRFDIVLDNFSAMVTGILDEYGLLDGEIAAILASILGRSAGMWSEMTGVAVGSAQETSIAVDVMADDIKTASEEASTAVVRGAGIIAEALEDEREAIGAVSSAASIASRQLIADNATRAQEARREAERLAAEVEQFGQQVRDIVSGNLADTLWELGTFYRKAQDAEEDHQQKMQDIIEGAADRLADINLSDQRRREDAQRDHNRTLEDIAEWYQEQVEAGEANTYEKKAALDAAKQEKIEAAEKTHKQKLEDLDISLTRATEDNTADRIKASDDELAAYEENIPKMGEVIKTGFESMANSIIQAGLDKAIDKTIDWLWNMAFEAEAAATATNTALATVGTGLSLSPLALAAIPIAIGTSSMVADWVADANSWLERLFGAFGLGSGADRGSVRVPAYGGGGVVPGPIGAPQLAVVHGGEPIGAAGFAEVLDYERMGQAVAAGVADAGGGGQPLTIIVQLDDRTRLAQALYDPLQRESERRGGTR